MDRQDIKQPWYGPGGAQGVAHQHATARAQLDEAQRSRSAHSLPDNGTPKPDQLAEHLADLRRRYEIPLGANASGALPVAIIRIGLAQPHVAIDGHRAVAPDERAQLVEQRGLLVVSPRVGHGPKPPCAAAPCGSSKCPPLPWAGNRGCRRSKVRS